MFFPPKICVRPWYLNHLPNESIVINPNPGLCQYIDHLPDESIVSIVMVRWKYGYESFIWLG
jgi:hypothetical protein